MLPTIYCVIVFWSTTTSEVVVREPFTCANAQEYVSLVADVYPELELDRHQVVPLEAWTPTPSE